MQFYFKLIFVTILLIKLSNQYRSKKPSNLIDRAKKNSHIIFKKLSPIELDENIPIGHLLIDLKSNLIDQHKNIDEFYFIFEFIPELSDKYSSSNLHPMGLSSLMSIKSFFLLDIYSGTIKTSKSIDLENFCDLNLCQNQNKLVNFGANEMSLSKIFKEDCLIQFKVKATRQLYTNKTAPQIQNYKEQVYHISFDLMIRDLNEFRPEFDQKDHLSFNISEEFSPIKLPIGSIAFDNDCSDRGQLFYTVKILKVNSRPLDEYLKEIKQFLSTSNRRSSSENIFDLEIVIEQDLLFLCTNRPFDREIHHNIELEMIASDRFDFNQANTASLKITLNIADINDNSPRFEQQVYNLEFDEGLAANTELIKLKAFDPDQGPNGEVKYEFAILTDEIRETFFMHSLTGSLILKRKLDHGKKSCGNCQYEQVIKA